MKLNEIKTLAELKKLDWKADLLPQAHIIIGDGGMCMCGIYDGEAMSCQKIINMLRNIEFNAPTGLDESEV